MSGWAETAKNLAEAAERARIDGDQVAMIALLKGAAECAQVARQLEKFDEISAGLRALRTAKR